MYSFISAAVQRLQATDVTAPGAADRRPMPHTVARILPETDYDWFTFKGAKPVTVSFRGKDIEIKKGTKFGVRPSTNGKQIRLIFPEDKNRVLTIDLETAQRLAKGV